jgi:hypothetical protein
LALPGKFGDTDAVKNGTWLKELKLVRGLGEGGGGTGANAAACTREPAAVVRMVGENVRGTVSTGELAICPVCSMGEFLVGIVCSTGEFMAARRTGDAPSTGELKNGVWRTGECSVGAFIMGGRAGIV